MLSKSNIMALCISTMVIVLTFLATPQGHVQAQDGDLERITWSIVWSPDGTRLATANPGGKIRIWDQAGKLLQTLSGHEGIAQSIAWSPDSLLVASGGSDAFIRIWNVSTGELIHQIQAFPYGTLALAWQPTGEYLIAASSDTFQAWRVSTWEPITPGIAVTLPDLEWSPDGSRFAFAALGNVGVGAIQNGIVTTTVFEKQHTAIVWSVNWNSDGSQIVSAGGDDGSIRLWDAATGKQLKILMQSDLIARDAAFTSSDGTQITAVTEQGAVYTLNALTGTVEEALTRNVKLRSVAWNPEENLIALSGLGNVPQKPNLGNAVETNFTTAISETGFLEITSNRNR